MTTATPDPQDAERSVLRKVIPYLWPEGDHAVKTRVVVALCLLVLAKVVTLITPLFFKEAVDALAPTEGSAQTTFLMLSGPVALVVGFGFARSGQVLFAQLRDVVFTRVGQQALRRLALQTFEHIHALSMRYHMSRKTGGLSRIIERGVKGVDFLLRFVLFSIGPLIVELTLMAGIFWYLFGFWYAVIVVATIALYTIFTFKVTEWRVAIRRRMNEADTDANQKSIDSLLNFETVKYFGAERREAARYDRSMANYEQEAVKTNYSLAALNFGQSIIITTGLVIVLVMAARDVQAGNLSVGDFTIVNMYMMQITMPLNFLGTVYREIRQALVDMGEMFGLLEQPAEVTDKPDAGPLNVAGGAISLDDVRFGYDAERPILKGVSLDIAAGQTVALVGHSGSGKSTIGRLLFRFYDVTGGAIQIDGQDLRDVTQESLRQHIGVVPQDTVLFNDTIGYNIAYGRPEATTAEVIEAARAAQIHDFIESLPDGYETKVGERGLKLSGGEKQRVGIARTILKNPPILLLDEATSALDTETEQGIQDSLQQMGEGRTVITIAHRLSTVVHADRIVVLDHGEVAESGTHEELLAAHGRYARMWAQQAAEDEEESPVTA
ncbi:ABCB family ABC transporter ATP-binding protein/permease [Pontivivens insulae]|uniref:ATM1-type heavy metal exporter n=1 Tax=Pontivivens insulae TaxID=1639689 RepID=A0A2R8AA75_9RHOB|nr:ABC transporter ATP-binding protein/permease [Pontivivens insulae]RED13044.1 ATP-binding cassette subfamily B protein [Pontivivens insulae]SPF29136.1 ATM1-type heavy metal exporter [Pontivivens insulae]